MRLLNWLFPGLLILGVLVMVYRSRQADRQPKSLPTPDVSEEFHDALPPFPVKASLHFNYTDREGQATQRDVDVWEVGVGMNGNILVGRCQLRGAMRTFYLHRILNCVDLETGEYIPDVYRYLRQKREASPEGSLNELLANEYDALRILLYVSKADGVLRAAERVIIRETCRALAEDSRITDAMIDRLFKDVDLMTERAFKMAVGRLAKRTRDIQSAVLAAAERMVATDKKVHPAEQAALDYMRKRWDGAASTT